MTNVELFHAFDQYQRGRGMADSTRHRRAMSLASFADFIAPRSITTTKPDDVDEWLTTFNAAGTKCGYYSDLKAFFLWAHRREHMAVNPMLLTDAPRKPKYLPKPARPDVIATAIAMSNGKVQLMILLGALAGLRVSEIAALSTDDIYLDRTPPVLMVVQGKGGKDRIVPLHPVLVAVPAAAGCSHPRDARVNTYMPSTLARRSARRCRLRHATASTRPLISSATTSGQRQRSGPTATWYS